MVDMWSGAGWVCDGEHLSDVLHPVHGRADFSELEDNSGGPVLLRQVEEGSPCLLTLRCGPDSSISRLLLISQAPTMEVYEHTGEYCGTVRGERCDEARTHSPDRRPFYQKQLILEHPSSSYEVKLLSLAGRTSVLLSRVFVGLQSLQSCPSRGPGVDMQQVQSLVEDMGTNLSPGAQNLMDMVQFQQKNQTSSLEGFLPLLMGAGAALTRGGLCRPAAAGDRPRPAASTSPDEDTSSPCARSLPAVPSRDISSPLSASVEHGAPISSAHLAGMMSHVLKGQTFSSGPELLPMLQSVCGQVTQLRLDDAENKKKSWELDSVMERRLEEMERRLKEHMDRRLDALEQKLEEALRRSLNHSVNHGVMSGSVGGGGEGGGGGTSEEPQTNF